MKLSLALIITAVSGAMSSSLGMSSSLRPVSAYSKMGLKLLKHARQLEEGDKEENEEGQDYYQNANAANITWVEDYSLKFIGCHQVAQWNTNADGDEDAVRIETSRFIRFRLCPTRYCVADRSVGCSSSYGDYIVDMDTFVSSHLENQQDLFKEKCQTEAENCGCDERRLEDGDDASSCLYSCYYSAGMEQCLEDGSSDLEFFENYGACDNFEYGGSNDGEGDNGEGDNGEGDNGEGDNGERRRKLDQQAVEYYIGPYCADQGGGVVLGMFTDDTCTTFADEYGGKMTYAQITGSSLPYSTESIIDGECHSCKQAGNDYYEDSVNEMCAETYEVSGKCETKLSHHLDSINENACNWIRGIEHTPISSSGIIHAKYHGSAKAAIAIAIFATLFVAFAFYVSILRRKIAMAEAVQIAKNRKGSPRRSLKKRFSFWLSFSRIFKRKKKKSASESFL